MLAAQAQHGPAHPSHSWDGGGQNENRLQKAISEGHCLCPLTCGRHRRRSSCSVRTRCGRQGCLTLWWWIEVFQPREPRHGLKEQHWQEKRRWHNQVFEPFEPVRGLKEKRKRERVKVQYTVARYRIEVGLDDCERTCNQGRKIHTDASTLDAGQELLQQLLDEGKHESLYGEAWKSSSSAREELERCFNSGPSAPEEYSGIQPGAGVLQG